MGAYLIWTVPGGSTYTLAFDIVESENPAFPTTITDHVVEQGADVSDNIRVGLQTVTLEVFVSNEPIIEQGQWLQGQLTPATQSVSPPNQPPVNPALQFLDVKTWFTIPIISIPIISALAAHEQDSTVAYNAGLPPTPGQLVSVNVLQFNNQINAVAQTHDALAYLQDNFQLVTVMGTEGTYDNMAVEHFEMTRTSDEGSGAKFTIQLKEIRQVSSVIVAAPKPSVPRGNTPTKKGTNTTTPNTNPANTQSLLSVLAGWFNGTTPPPGLQP